MFDAISALGLEPWQWALGIVAGLLVGFAKTGIGGVGILAAVLLASIFDAKESTGILLPMLCMADVFAVKYYHRHCDWKLLLKPLPWAVIGILIGVVVGNQIDAKQFRLLLGGLVFVVVMLMILREIFADENKIPTHPAFAALLGLAGGFSTMVGNAAGPVWAIYLLALRLPKYAFIGTGAWFFLILNLFKVPFHIFVWNTISLGTFGFDLALLPAIAVGAVLGVWTVKRVNEKVFRRLVQVLAVVAALKMVGSAVKDIFFAA